MEQVNEAQPQSQPPSQRFYALEQLGELAGTITLISEGLQAYRAQVAGLLAGQKKAEAFELYRLLERQRTYLVEQIRATRPFLMELENPLAPAAQKLAEQLAAFPLMTADYSKLTEVLKRFADALPDHQTTDASIIGRLMNNVRLGHYPTDLTHVGYIANSIVFPAENTANLIDPCCGTGDALLRLALGTDSQCYPHIVKGRIIKEKHTVTDENRGPHGRLISTEIRETISNRMIFNILTPSGFRSLT